jgi:SHS2 domain-containing protein
MERYRILDHAADGKLRAFGATLEEAFANAALGLVSLMIDWERVEPRLGHEISVEAPDVEGLLVRFLSEILYLSDARAFVLAGVEAVRIEEPDRGPGASPESGGSGAGESAAGGPPWRLSARFVGDDRPERYDFHGDVKAVTYSEMKIEKCAGGGTGGAGHRPGISFRRTRPQLKSEGGCPGSWMVQVVVDL